MSAGAAQQAVLSARPPVPSPTPPQQRSPDPASDAHASIPLNVKGLVEAARRVRGSTHSLAALALHSTLVAAAFGTRIRLASAGNAAAPQAPPARTVEAVAAVLLHARQFSELLADMPLLRQLLRQLQTSRTVAMLHSQLERLSESMQLDVRKVEGVGQLAVDDLRNAVDKLLGLLDKDLIPTNQILDTLQDMELFLDELTNMLTVTSSETAGRVRGRVEMLRGSLLARAPWPLRPPAKWMVPRDGVFAAGGTDPVGHCTLGPLLTARIPTMPSHPAANGRTALGASSVPDAPTTPGAALLNFSFMFPRSVRLVTIVPVVAQKPVVDALAANMDRWRTLSHPNIAAPAGMCVNTDHPFLVLPHLHSDLFTIQAHQDGTEMSTKVRWIADIARGMRYLHSQHPPIVHGRLSLSNVLLDHTGCARIVGLGMEKTASWPQSQGRITWLPPELAKNTKSPLTLKSDVFAFGLTCASVLAGPLYASQESYQRALENWESISARPGRPPRISPFLWSLIERCWSVDPDDRPEFGHILVELSQIPGAVSQAEMGFMGVVAASDPAMSSAETRPRKRSFEADMLEKPASKHLRRQRSMSITSGPVLGPSLAPDEQIAVLLEVLPAFMAGKGITADNWRVKVNSFENDNTRTAIARDDEGNIVVLRGKIDELCAFPTKITTLSHLRTLALSSSKLTGRLPPEIGRLQNLKHCSLYWNHIEGEIPKELFTLRKLRSLLLGRNMLFGELPRDISQLKHLKELSLYLNKFSGPLPQELCEIKALEVFNISQNHFSGSIPDGIWQLRNLTQLMLNANKLTGEIPEAIGNLVNLTVFRISNNRLCGAIPRSIGNLVRLESLQMDSNMLEGPIPAELANLKRLRILTLHTNNLTLPPPDQLTSMLSKLKCETKQRTRPLLTKASDHDLAK